MVTRTSARQLPIASPQPHTSRTIHLQPADSAEKSPASPRPRIVPPPPPPPPPPRSRESGVRGLTDVRPPVRNSQPRAQRYFEQRRRSTRHAYTSLAALLTMLLVMGIAAGYLIGAGRDSPRAAPAREIRLLEQRLSARIAEGLAIMEKRVGDIRAQAFSRRPSRAKPDTRTKSRKRAKSQTKDPKSLAKPTQARGGTRVIASMDGSGPRTTDPFTARNPWQIEWRGADVFIFVKRAKDGSLVHADGGQGRGSFVIREGGRFVMDVLARGTWSISVVSS